MSFTVPRDDLRTAIDALEAVREELGIGAVTSDPDMAKVSVVGAGMKSHPGVAAKTFSVLGQAGVNIEMISTSPIKISCVIREEHVEKAVQELHAAFELGDGTIHREDVSRRPPAGGELADARRRRGRHRRRRLHDPRRHARARLSRRRGRAAGLRALGGRAGSTGASQRLPSRSSTEDAMPGLRPGAVLGRRLDQRRVGAAGSPTPAPWWSTTPPSGACTTTCRWWWRA